MSVVEGRTGLHGSVGHTFASNLAMIVAQKSHSAAVDMAADMAVSMTVDTTVERLDALLARKELNSLAKL